jgi:deoxyribodipyrimidine photo-lyase
MKNSAEINVVWLKRDIRSQDHLPLYHAEQSDLPYLLIYLFEPSLMQYPDCSLRHLQFQFQSLTKLNERLHAYNGAVTLCHAEALTVFTALQKQYTIKNLFSYQESGTQITYNRDKAVGAFCIKNNIAWQEFQRDGIIRGIKNRKDWDKTWFATMHEPLIQNTFTANKIQNANNNFPLSQALKIQLAHTSETFQPAGETYAFKYLTSFVQERGRNYSKYISKPTESRKSCSRLSPYISWGNISVKQAYQFIYASLKVVPHAAPLKNALTRLKWHCHFIQKFEVDCSYETQCINTGYELLEHPTNQAHIEAWKNGRTGFPLVDACMLCLKATGWINFRMRAMLVSFFCHHLYQDWRTATYHLAQLFLDYEPGIHYPQFQMQAGTTGINTIRIYNPIKQSQEHDPDGVFIKRWLPELQNVPTAFIHEPYKMTSMDQQFCQFQLGKDYPLPVINLETTGKNAREKIWGHRKNEIVKKENARIVQTHTRNNKFSNAKRATKPKKDKKEQQN